MRIKRFLTGLLAAALAASLASRCPRARRLLLQRHVRPDTAVNADMLRLMGVVDGTGGNRFNPGGT
ncbi:MAG: hypothetical protein V8S34_01705 [Lawsonibacter sp.]